MKTHTIKVSEFTKKELDKIKFRTIERVQYFCTYDSIIRKLIKEFLK